METNSEKQLVRCSNRKISGRKTIAFLGGYDVSLPPPTPPPPPPRGEGGRQLPPQLGVPPLPLGEGLGVRVYQSRRFTSSSRFTPGLNTIICSGGCVISWPPNCSLKAVMPAQGCVLPPPKPSPIRLRPGFAGREGGGRSA